MKISTLTIEMAADVARLRQDMDRAQKAVDSALGGIKGAANAAMKVLGSLGLGFSAFKFGTFIRGAINAADEMSKLSQKMGVAVKDVAGLQLAFRQSGLEAGALQANMARLSRGIADGNKALEAMGVVTRNTDGSLRTTRQVLGDVADRFASYENGAAKAALAQELFGRSGADMIPLLNGGAAALDEFDAMAQRLGLTLDEETARQAEKFNDTLDLMGQGVQGVGRQVAAQLLPTLSGLASQFFTTMSEGDRLSRIADGLSAVLRGLYVVALGVVEAFSTVGRVLGGVSAIIVSVFKGDFSAARNIAQELRNDLTGGWKDTLAQMQNAWKATGNASFEALATANAEARRQPPLIEAATRAVERRAAVDREALRRELEAARLRNAAFDEEERRLEAIRLASERRIRTAREMLEGIQFETSLLRMNNTQRRIAIAMRDLERQGVVAGTEAYDALAQRIRDAIEAQEEMKASLANAPVLDTTEWDRHWEQVSQSFTDALMQGGRSVAEYLKSLFRTMVLRPILAPVGAAFGGMFGGSAMAGQSGGMGGGLGMLGQIGSLFGQAGSFAATGAASMAFNGGAATAQAVQALWANGAVTNAIGMAAGAAGAAFGGYMAGNAIRQGISNGFSVSSGFDTFQKLGMAVGSAVGGPVMGALIGAGAGAFNRMFGRKLADSGIQGNFSSEGFAGQSFTFEKGGWFRSDKTRTSALDAGVQAALGQQFQAMQLQVAAMAMTLGQGAESVLGFTTSIRLSLKGLSEEQAQQKLAYEMQRIGNAMADLVPGLADFALAGESSSETLTRLAGSLTEVNASLYAMGMAALESSLAGAQAAYELTELAGGMDAFRASQQRLYESAFSSMERLARAVTLMDAEAQRLNVNLPRTVQELRSMIEAQDLMTRAGRETTAALLQMAPAMMEVKGAVQNMLGLSVDSISGILRNVLSNAETEADARRMAEEQSIAMLYSGLTNSLFQSVSSIIMDGITGQMIPALIGGAAEAAAIDAAGASVSAATLAAGGSSAAYSVAAGGAAGGGAVAQGGAVAGSALAGIVNQAIQTINTMSAIMSNPAFRAAMGDIGVAVGQIAGSMFAAGVGGSRGGGGISGGNPRSGSRGGSAGQDRDRELLTLMRQLRSGIDALSVSTREMDAAQWMASASYLREAANDARMAATLPLKDDRFERALKTVTGNNESLFRTQAEMAVAQAIVANDLLAIEQVAGRQLSSAERQLYEARVSNDLLGSILSVVSGGEHGTIRVPGFARGGDHMGGLRLVGEAGPELESTGPSRIISHDRLLGAISTNEDVRAELAQMRSDLMAGLRAIEKNTREMKQIEQRWDRLGLPETREVA